MPKRILAVDDEPSIVKLVTATLTAKGYEVIQAFDGPEAIDKAKLERPDLIICDIMMPRMDGREVRRRLAADPDTADIPLIFLSAIGDLDQQLHTLEEGGAEYLTKPFKPSELADYVAVILDPARKEELTRIRQQHVGRLRAMTSIMHRKQ